jgi:uncharacterized protein with HEPN domain
MAGAGNIYRDDYEDVAAQLVWEIVKRALPPLKGRVEKELNGWLRRNAYPLSRRQHCYWPV